MSGRKRSAPGEERKWPMASALQVHATLDRAAYVPGEELHAVVHLTSMVTEGAHGSPASSLEWLSVHVEASLRPARSPSARALPILQQPHALVDSDVPAEHGLIRAYMVSVVLPSACPPSGCVAIDPGAASTASPASAAQRPSYDYALVFEGQYRRGSEAFRGRLPLRFTVLAAPSARPGLAPAGVIALPSCSVTAVPSVLGADPELTGPPWPGAGAGPGAGEPRCESEALLMGGEEDEVVRLAVGGEDAARLQIRASRRAAAPCLPLVLRLICPPETPMVCVAVCARMMVCAIGGGCVDKEPGRMVAVAEMEAWTEAASEQTFTLLPPTDWARGRAGAEADWLLELVLAVRPRRRAPMPSPEPCSIVRWSCPLKVSVCPRCSGRSFAAARGRLVFPPC